MLFLSKSMLVGGGLTLLLCSVFGDGGEGHQAILIDDENRPRTIQLMPQTLGQDSGDSDVVVEMGRSASPEDKGKDKATTGQALGGMGGGAGEPGGEGGGAKQDESIGVIYLKLMAKNVLADAPNGQKVRTRETLNREFATMMAKQFRRNELFSDDETLTKVDGQILMKEIDGTRWFEFVIQLTLKDSIVMKDKEVE